MSEVQRALQKTYRKHSHLEQHRMPFTGIKINPVNEAYDKREAIAPMVTAIDIFQCSMQLFVKISVDHGHGVRFLDPYLTSVNFSFQVPMFDVAININWGVYMTVFFAMFTVVLTNIKSI